MKYFILSFSILAFLILPLIAYAQTDPCAPLESGYPNSYKLCGIVDSIGDILSIIGLTLGIAVIIIAGITYLTSAGDPAKANKAKKILIYGLIGVAIVVAAYAIVDLIKDFVIEKVATIYYLLT